LTESEAAILVRRVVAGDRHAWPELVERYSGMMWAVARSHRLSQHAAADVVQDAWLRLIEHIDDIREPAHVGGWLATTTRREALRVITARRHEDTLGNALLDRADPLADGPDDVLIHVEEYEALHAALRMLPAHQARLLRLLSVEPRPSYAEVGAALDMPVGSIGPTRARALARLRTLLAASDSPTEPPAPAARRRPTPAPPQREVA
jgi:RNA polymerase sigma factor (sigma-70 family)